MRRHAARTIPLLLAVAAALAPPAPAAETIDAGAMRAEVTADPWHLAFTQPGGPTLSENRGTSTTPAGTLGFRTPAGWWHATRALSSTRDANGLSAELATTDPSGRTLRVRIEPSGEGAVGVTAAVTGAGLGDV